MLGGKSPTLYLQGDEAIAAYRRKVALIAKLLGHLGAFPLESYAR